MATPWGAILEVGGNLIDELFTSDEERAEAKLKMTTLLQQGKLEMMQTSMSAINNEAKSEHKMVALARPSFMYVFYFIVLMLVAVFPIIGIFHIEAMEQLYLNVGIGFKAIPPEMWTTFTVGYLGYTGAREYGKHSKNKHGAGK